MARSRKSPPKRKATGRKRTRGYWDYTEAEREEARRLAAKALGLEAPKLTEDQERDLQAHYAEAAKNLTGAPSDWPPFPPRLYDDDGMLLSNEANDPKVMAAAVGALRRLRFAYESNPVVIRFLARQLDLALDLAIDMRGEGAESYGLDLPKVPSPSDPEQPVKQDFMRLEQWFGDAAVAISKGADIGRGQPALDVISTSVAVTDYCVSRHTIARHVKDGTLQDYRPVGATTNSPFQVSRAEVAKMWPRRS